MMRVLGTLLTDRPTTTLYAAAALSTVAAAANLSVTPGHFDEGLAYGTFSWAFAAAQTTYGLFLLIVPRRSVFLLGIAGNLAILVLWLSAHTGGVPLLGWSAGEVKGTGWIDLLATVTEAALVVALAVLLRGRGLFREGWAMVALGVGLALTFLGYLVDLGAH